MPTAGLGGQRTTVARREGHDDPGRTGGLRLVGATFHAPLLRAAGLDLVALVSANPERADQARAENPGVTLVPDVGALLALPGLDLVVVASPSGRHVENAEAIIEAGIAVVVDKPLACDAGGAQGLVDVAAGEECR